MKLAAILLVGWTVLLASLGAATRQADGVFNVRNFGAAGDGVALDTEAINRTIKTASAAGEGTVLFPAGTYLSFSIRLESNITLSFEAGSTLVAASPAPGFGAYDPPEPNEWGEKFQYQDFGHSHWHNSLIWGENLENISIVGPGRIHGKGLVRNAGTRHSDGPNGTPAINPAGVATGPGFSSMSSALPVGGAMLPGNVVGAGNKAIALKNCHRVTIRDVSLLSCGHLAVLATGVDQLVMENVSVDTNRDGFDVDGCRQVTISRCRVNTPNDDGIVLKSSYALGVFRDVEDVRIADCAVTGFDVGTLLDGTRQKTMERAPDRDGPTGRIKLARNPVVVSNG
jgi:polygalacturonase